MVINNLATLRIVQTFAAGTAAGNLFIGWMVIAFSAQAYGQVRLYTNKELYYRQRTRWMVVQRTIRAIGFYFFSFYINLSMSEQPVFIERISLRGFPSEPGSQGMSVQDALDSDWRLPAAVYRVATVLRVLVSRTGAMVCYHHTFTCPTEFWLCLVFQTAMVPGLMWNAVATAKMQVSNNPEYQQTICSMYRVIQHLTVLPVDSQAVSGAGNCPSGAPLTVAVTVAVTVSWHVTSLMQLQAVLMYL